MNTPDMKIEVMFYPNGETCTLTIGYVLWEEKETADNFKKRILQGIAKTLEEMQ